MRRAGLGKVAHTRRLIGQRLLPVTRLRSGRQSACGVILLVLLFAQRIPSVTVQPPVACFDSTFGHRWVCELFGILIVATLTFLEHHLLRLKQFFVTRSVCS